MKKLSLTLDDLHVDSFVTATEKARAGTVMGHMPPYSMWTCPQVGCVEETAGCPNYSTACETQYQTCQHTCADGCHLSMDGGAEFTCDPNCFSYETNCHRCTF